MMIGGTRGKFWCVTCERPTWLGSPVKVREAMASLVALTVLLPERNQVGYTPMPPPYG